MFIVCVDVCLCGHEFLRACGKFAGSFTLTLSSRVFVQAGEPGAFIYVKWGNDLGNCLPKASLGNQLGVIKLGSGWNSIPVAETPKEQLCCGQGREALHTIITSELVNEYGCLESFLVRW